MTKKNFIEPPVFFREVILALNAGKITPELSKIFLMIAEKYANHSYWVRYPHLRQDIISSALVGCVQGFPKFAPYRNRLVRDEDGEIIEKHPVAWNGEIVDYHYETCNNPFAYFTTCMYNEIVSLMKSEYNQRNINNKLKLTMGLEADPGYLDMIKKQEDEAKAVAVEKPENIWGMKQ